MIIIIGATIFMFCFQWNNNLKKIKRWEGTRSHWTILISYTAFQVILIWSAAFLLNILTNLLFHG